jgi:hypothetical protein
MAGTGTIITITIITDGKLVRSNESPWFPSCTWEPGETMRFGDILGVIYRRLI